MPDSTPGTPGSPGNPAAGSVSGAPGSPGAPGTPAQPETPSLHFRVAAILNRIRPAVQSDGGDLELVEITPDNIVKIRLLGACVGCPSSTITLKSGIERNVREKIPEIVAVEQVD